MKLQIPFLRARRLRHNWPQIESQSLTVLLLALFRCSSVTLRMVKSVPDPRDRSTLNQLRPDSRQKVSHAIRFIPGRHQRSHLLMRRVSTSCRTRERLETCAAQIGRKTQFSTCVAPSCLFKITSSRTLSHTAVLDRELA